MINLLNNLLTIWRKFMKLSNSKQFAIIFAVLMFAWGIYSLVTASSINSDAIATVIVLFLIGISYPLTIFVPGWTKAAILIDGIVFAVVGAILLVAPSNLVMIILGVILIILSLLAYVGKLPPRLLRMFYR